MFSILLFLLMLPCFHSLKMESFQHSEISIEIVKFIRDHKVRDLLSDSQTMIIVSDETRAAEDVHVLFAKRLHIPNVILSGNEQRNHQGNLLATIAYVFVQDENKLDEIFEKLIHSNIYTVITYTVIVEASQVTDVAVFNISARMERIWNYGLTNYITIYFTDEVQAVSYNPFTKTIDNVSRKKGMEFFPNYFADMHGYRLRVGLFEEWPILKKKNTHPEQNKWVGMDYEILEILKKTMNVTIEIVEPPAGTRFRGAVEDILRKKVDFCFVRRFQEKPIAGIEYLSIGDLSTLDVLVPVPKQLTQNEVFLSIFQTEIWIALLVSITLVTSYLRFHIVNSYRHLKLTTAQILLDVWGILLNLAVKDFPKFNRVLKIPIIFWVWACLIFHVCFQCRLITTMQFPRYDNGIKTLSDLEKSNLYLYSAYNYSALHGDSNFLKNKLRLMNSYQMQSVLRNNDSNSVVVLPFAIVRGYINPDIFPNSVKPSHEILLEALSHSFAVYMFPTHSPFRNEINKNIFLQKQYGFVEKFNGRMKEVDIVQYRKLELSLQHLEPSFYVLSIGYSLSLTAFLWEIIQRDCYGKATKH